MLITALKGKKGTYDYVKENLYFKQSRLKYLNNLKQKQKNNLRLCPIGVDVATGNEMFILSTTKIYSYFQFLFSVLRKVERDVATLKIVTTMQIL